MRKLFTFMAFVATWAAAFAAAPSFLSHNSARHAPMNAEYQDADLMHVGYLGSDAVVYPYDGLQVDADMDLQVAVKLNKDVLSPYAGTKIVKLRFAWSNPDHTGDIHWTVRSSRDGEPLAQGDATLSFSWSDAWDKAGWNVIELPEGIDITAETEELWLGYTVNMHANEYSIPTLVYGTYYPDTQYVMRLDDPEWMDISMDYGPLYLEALVVDERTDVMPSVKLQRMTSLPIQVLDTPTTGDMWLLNDGSRAINNVKLEYSLGDKVETYDLKFGKGVAPGASGMVEVPIYALGTGTHKLSVTAINDMELPEPKTIEYPMVGVPQEVADQYQRMGVVEYFCSENDYNSPRYYDELIIPGLQGYTDQFILLCQHVADRWAMRDDEATEMLLDYVDGDKSLVYMPVMTFDRTWYPGTGDSAYPNSPATFVLYPYFAQMTYDIAKKVPAFASVAATAETDGTNYTVHVTGDVHEGILPQDENLNLTVYLVEDGIESSEQELPDDDWTDIHYPDGIVTLDNVIREQPTPIYGDPLPLSGTFDKTYTGTLPEDCNTDNLRVVALLNRPASNDRWNRNAVNATQSHFVLASVVDLKANAQSRLYARGGSILSSDGAPVVVYDLAGRKVANHGLQPGIYLARTRTTTAKVMVK